MCEQVWLNADILHLTNKYKYILLNSIQFIHLNSQSLMSSNLQKALFISNITSLISIKGSQKESREKMNFGRKSLLSRRDSDNHSKRFISEAPSWADLFSGIEKPARKMENNEINNSDELPLAEDDQNKIEFQKKNESHEEIHTDSCSKLTIRMTINEYMSWRRKSSDDEIKEKVIQILKEDGFKVPVVETNKFLVKYALTAPYYLFFSLIQNCAEACQDNFIIFPEILDQSFGEIMSSLHITFVVDATWLCLQYILAGQRIDMTILYGLTLDEDEETSIHNVTMIPVKMIKDFGCHHTKLTILKYKDNGIRVVIFTANLYSSDWKDRMQGIWISPHLPRLPDLAKSEEGESSTYFKKDFLQYLRKYRLTHRNFTQWIFTVARADFSAVNVVFIGSVPGTYKQTGTDSWGYKKLAYVLSKDSILPLDTSQWPVVALCSAVGSFGKSYKSWLLKDIVSSMTKKGEEHPDFQFIYPSINTFKNSFDYQRGCSCLCYNLEQHLKQQWIHSYLHHWKSEKIEGSLPHIKCYTRISPDFKKIPWFFLTSANLSKSAWGKGSGTFYHINNYEVGILFLPEFVTGTTTFPIKEEANVDMPIFPIPYDLPLTIYGPDDKPYVSEAFEGYE